MLKKHIRFLLLTAAMVAIITVIALPRAASAQCGSAASSCKNCHEVQKADPINAKGAWHTAHAFGDFCEFCHAGNAKSKDKDAAHTGMLAPLADVKAGCQSCHPNDYMDRAQKYADALGKPIGSGGAPTTASPIVVAGTTTTTANSNCGPAAPTGGQTIDLNQVYADMTKTAPSNIGNLILIGLIAAVALLLVGLIFYYERPVQRGIAAFRQLLATPVLATADAGAVGNLPQRAEVGALLPLLASNDTATLRAVQALLSDRENGPKLLKALSHMDLATLTELSEHDQKALASLLTLAKEMKS